jgi:uncharacterized protein involved in exopolysaccharide biosynthesis
MPKPTQSTNKQTSPPSGYFAPYYTDADQISIIDCVQAVTTYKKMFIIIAALVLIISVAIAIFMTPVYRAEALLAPVKEDNQGTLSQLANQFGGIGSLIGMDSLNTNSEMAESIAILTSRKFSEEFIDDDNLLPILFHKKWNSKSSQWKTRSVDEIPTLRDGARLFKENILSVTKDEESGLLILAIEWSDRDLAVEWANLLVKRANKQLRERKILETEASLNFLHKELDKTNVVEIRQSIFRLIESYTKAIMLANVNIEYAFRIIDPAAPLEKEDKIRPKRALILIIGFLVGCLLGALAAILRYLPKRDILETI